MCVRHVTRVKDEETTINAAAKEIPENAPSNKVDEVILKTDDLRNKQSKQAGTQTDEEYTVSKKNTYKSIKYSVV